MGISLIDLCEYYGILFYENDDIELMDLTRYCGIDMGPIMSYLTKNRGNRRERQN